MRLKLKELLAILNTACIAGIIIYLHYADSNAALIGGLIVLISFITILLLHKAVWKHRSRNY
jgi:hypothetical protein